MERLTGWNGTETWPCSDATVRQPRGNSSVTEIAGSVNEASVEMYHPQVLSHRSNHLRCYSVLDVLFACVSSRALDTAAK